MKSKDSWRKADGGRSQEAESQNREDALLESLAEILFDKWLEDKNKKKNE